jgi:hypothetical protein
MTLDKEEIVLRIREIFGLFTSTRKQIRTQDSFLNSIAQYFEGNKDKVGYALGDSFIGL